MIYPTEMTLATGTTVYAGDPESDECIRSREVRVSVTYRIEEQEDFDLADFAFAKAAEVERARIAALERIERDRADPYEPPGGAALEPNDSSFNPDDPALEPPDDQENDEDASDPFPEEADYLHARCGSAPNGVCAGNGGHPGKGMSTWNGASPLPPALPAGTRGVTEAETDWATKPQVLALQSHFRRLGLSPENQTALLRARFGKFRPERLTKDEAAGLMRYFERGEWEPAEAALAH